MQQVIVPANLGNFPGSVDSSMFQTQKLQVTLEKVILWLPSHVAYRETFPLHVVHHSHFTGSASLEANGTNKVIVPYISLPGGKHTASVVFLDGGNILFNHTDAFALRTVSLRCRFLVWCVDPIAIMERRFSKGECNITKGAQIFSRGQ